MAASVHAIYVLSWAVGREAFKVSSVDYHRSLLVSQPDTHTHMLMLSRRSCEGRMPH